MAKFNATVRVFDLEAPDRQTARLQLEAKLQNGDLGRARVVAIEGAASPLPVRQPRLVRPRWVNTALGPLLLLGAVVWMLWFYWLLFD